MDLNEFANPAFDPKDWINRTLRNIDKDDNKDSTVTSLSVKLQLYFHQLNNEFEGTALNVIQNLPRVMRETEILSEEAATLRDKMNSVKQEIEKVGKNTGLSIASLERIDRLKIELTKAKEALHEADNWTVLSTDVEAVFETGDIDAITSKLVSMQQSLNVLSNVADYENKKIQLEGLKNRLEALASPQMVQAFTSKSIDQSKRFVKIFQDINRLPQLLKYYMKCQKALLIQNWHSMIEIESEENILELLNNFYGVLIVTWQEQIKWCDSVIPEIPVFETLIELYIDLLINLTPEFCLHIENNLKQMSDPLLLLLQLKQITQQFAGNLKSLTDNLNQNPSQIIALAKAVYLPYVTHISKYGVYQQAVLHPQLTSLVIEKDDIMDSVQNLDQLNSKMLILIKEARKMCEDLTEGCGYPGYISTVEWFINNYLDQYRLIIKEIDEQKEKQEDVNLFQMCLTILQQLGDFINKIKQLDQECIQNLNELRNTYTKSESHPFFLYPMLLLNAEKQKEFNNLLNNLSDLNESVLKPVLLLIEKVCKDVYETTFQVIFAPISTLLESVPTASAWKNKQILSSDLPDYSYVPQEYITQIGQYLMNLPQLLEPFLLTENPALTLALSMVRSEYAQLADADENGFAEIFLHQIAESTCQAYCDQILGIYKLSSTACKQLATDINYLGNVLEDLGFSLTEKLQNIVMLLKLSPAEYSSQCSGCSPQIVAAVRQMRNIISE